MNVRTTLCSNYIKKQIILNVVDVQTMECVVITLYPLWSFGRRLGGLEIVAKVDWWLSFEKKEKKKKEMIVICIDLLWFISCVKEERQQSQNPFTEWEISSNTSGYILKGLR